MNWQNIIVAIVAVIVAVVVVIKVWRFFACRDKSSCSSCNKECRHRR